MPRSVKFVDGKLVYSPTRSPSAARGGGKKLNIETAIAVFREAHAHGARYAVIGAKYGVTSKTVSSIAAGKAYAYMFTRENIEDTPDYWIWETAAGKPRYRMTHGRRNKRSMVAMFRIGSDMTGNDSAFVADKPQRSAADIQGYITRNGVNPPAWWYESAGLPVPERGGGG